MTSVVVSTFGEPELICVTMLALARQSLRPDEVIVADDGSPGDTLAALGRLATDLPFRLVHAWQPHDGFRAARSRNNALRETRGDFVACLDQDTVPHRGWLENYRRNVPAGHVGLGFILRLPDEQSARVNRATVSTGEFEKLHDAAEMARLNRLQRKFRFYAWRRRVGIPSRNRPALGSGNFAAWRSDIIRVNGFDEDYVGWGQEDDDLGRRLYLAGVRPVPLVDSALVSHIAHPPRRPADWKSGANVGRYAGNPHDIACARGISARPYPDVKITVLRE